MDCHEVAQMRLLAMTDFYFLDCFVALASLRAPRNDKNPSQILRFSCEILRFRRIYRKNRRISQKSTADSAICANFAESTPTSSLRDLLASRGNPRFCDFAESNCENYPPP
ncbi:hypothetical protein ACWIUD_03360 [Helicobacter sp. 23-1044]